MAYQRFLNDKDYLALITQEGLDQLIREVHDRIPQAESSAEVSVLEYLRQYYEVERELDRGKHIKPYSEMMTYPAGIYFYHDNGEENGASIYRTLTAINGYKKPSTIVYWALVTKPLSTEQLNCTPHYSQLETYMVGQMVRYGGEIWFCNYQNGYDFKDIRIPGMSAWEQVEVVDWAEAMNYELYQVAAYDGKFYMLMAKDESYDALQTPYESDCWGQIADYDINYEYAFGENDHDYVVYENRVFRPIINPNADKLEENVNIVRDDPRNPSLVKHMTQLALYQLHVLISPTNISETRRIQYEDSMAWLYAASKFKIIIDIKRKINDADGKPRKDYALATYQKDFDPWQNDWII